MNISEYLQKPFLWNCKNIQKTRNVSCRIFSKHEGLEKIKRVALGMFSLLSLPFTSVLFLTGKLFGEAKKNKDSKRKSIKITCIDVGGTAIKTASLPTKPNKVDLQQAKIEVYHSSDWLNHRLPDLFAKIILKNKETTRAALPMDVIDHAFVERGDLSVPRDLSRIVKNKTGEFPYLINDSEAWLKGMIHFKKIVGETVEYPCMSIVIGTGVAVAISKKEGEVEVLSLSSQKNNFVELEKVSGRKIHHSWEVHGIVGREFFEWANSMVMDDHTISFEHSKRVEALLQDIVHCISEDFKPTKTLFIAGGNSRYLDSESSFFNRSDVAIELLTPPKMLAKGFDHNLMPLLGLIA